jgi:hypothetical protein
MKSKMMLGMCKCGHAGWVHDTTDTSCRPPQGCDCEQFDRDDCNHDRCWDDDPTGAVCRSKGEA